MEEKLSAVKTKVKKTKNLTKKSASKTVKKVTIDDVWVLMAEVQKAQKETQRIVGDLGNRFGDIAEHFLTPDLRKKFKKFGFTFNELHRNTEWESEEHNFLMEFDALLENGTQAMIVEAKAKLDKNDVNEQIIRMEKVRKFADIKNDNRQFYCALAAMTAKKEVIKHALENGFYLIMPSGEDVKVTAPLIEPRFW